MRKCFKYAISRMNINYKFPKTINDVLDVFPSSRKDNVIRSLRRAGLEQNIDYIRVVENSERHSYSYYLTQNGYEMLLVYMHITTRKCDAALDKSLLNVQYVKRYLPKETEIINFICDTFSPLYKIEKQYHIGKYRVDLYFIDKKIVVECDEDGHKDRDIEYEQNRENYIKQQLSCTFLRFNPDEPNFKLSSVITKLLYVLDI